MKKINEICWGCFGASFGDCEDCPTIKRQENMLDLDDIEIYSDLHEEVKDGKKEEVL